MPLVLVPNVVIPDDMGSNIREGSTVAGAPTGDSLHWVAAIKSDSGGLYYPRSADGNDIANAAINNLDTIVASTAFVYQLLASQAGGGIADGTLSGFTYNPVTRVANVTTTTGASYSVTLPVGTGTIAGVLALALSTEPLQPLNDIDAATPAYVKKAIDAIAAVNELHVVNYTYNTVSRQLVIEQNNASTFTVTLPLANGSSAGMVQLATSVEGLQPTNNADATTPAYVAAAIAAIPAAPSISTATTTVEGTTTLTPAGYTAANPTNVSRAVTPADLVDYAGAAKAASHPFATINAGEGLTTNQPGTLTNQAFTLDWDGAAITVGEPITGNGTSGSPLALTTGAGLAKVSNVLVNTQALVQSVTAPVSPVVGSRWENQSAATVAGVPAGAIATWNGTAWKVDTNDTTGTAQSWQIIAGVVRLDVTKAYEITANVRNIPINGDILFSAQAPTVNFQRLLTCKAVNGTTISQFAVQYDTSLPYAQPSLLSTIKFRVRFSAPLVDNARRVDASGVLYAQDTNISPNESRFYNRAWGQVNSTGAVPITHSDIGMSYIGNTVDGFLAVEVRELYI